jgi:hypothetical protein
LPIHPLSPVPCSLYAQFILHDGLTRSHLQRPPSCGSTTHNHTLGNSLPGPHETSRAHPQRHTNRRHSHKVRRQDIGHNSTGRVWTWSFCTFYAIYACCCSTIYTSIPQTHLTCSIQVHVPLESTDPTLLDRRSQLEPEFDGADLLPLAHLTATTVLGGGDPEVNTLGQLLGTQIASAIAARNPEEKRLLVVGMGLKRKTVEGEDFLSLLEMAMSCLG